MQRLTRGVHPHSTHTLASTKSHDNTLCVCVCVCTRVHVPGTQVENYTAQSISFSIGQSNAHNAPSLLRNSQSISHKGSSHCHVDPDKCNYSLFPWTHIDDSSGVMNTESGTRGYSKEEGFAILPPPFSL